MLHQRAILLFVFLILLGIALAEKKTKKTAGKKEKGGDTSLLGTGKSSKGAGKSSKGSSKSPKGSEKSPKGSSKSPKGSGKSPKGSSKSPKGSSKSPKGSSKSPKGSSKSPKGSSKSPKGESSTGSGGKLTVPPSCISRGQEFSSLKPNLNGTPREWLAATCPGVFRGGEASSDSKGKKKKGGDDSYFKESQGSLFEACAWSLSHGMGCQKCAIGYSQKPDETIGAQLILNGCRMRYPFELPTWTHSNGNMENSFIGWINGEAKGREKIPLEEASAFLNKLCPGIFSGPETPPSGESSKESCVWGGRMGAKCFAKLTGAPVLSSVETMLEKMCTKFE